MKYLILILLLVSIALGGYFYSQKTGSSQDASTEPVPAAVVAVAIPSPVPPPAADPVTNAQPVAIAPTPVPIDNSPIPTEWTILGRDYHNVKVIEVLPDKVRITYDGGIGSPLLKDLDPDLRKHFAYDPAKAQAAQDAEDQARAKAVIDTQAISAATAPPEAQTPSSLPTASTPQPASISPAAAAQIQARIYSLNQDIAFMQQEDAKTYDNGLRLKSNGDHLTRGAYADRIVQEQAEVSQLQAQLAAH